MAHRLKHIPLVHLYATVYLVVILEKNKLTLQPVAMMLILLFLLTLVRHMCTDLNLAMVQ
jgi:hypothetical protein